MLHINFKNNQFWPEKQLLNKKKKYVYAMYLMPLSDKYIEPLNKILRWYKNAKKVAH